MPEVTLKPGDVVVINLPDGQSVVVDNRLKTTTDIEVLDPRGFTYESLEIAEWQDDLLDPDPSLSDAERNPNLR